MAASMLSHLAIVFQRTLQKRVKNWSALSSIASFYLFHIMLLDFFVVSEEERSCILLLQLQNTISDFSYWKFVGFLKQIYLTSILRSKKLQKMLMTQ
jgi:hypothetical protein